MQIIDCPEAMLEYNKCQELLNESQKQRLLHATLSQDKEDWCIMSGPDLLVDRAGFGSTIAAAMQDYVSIYVKKTS